MTASDTGVVCLNDLPDNVRVILKQEFHCCLSETLNSYMRSRNEQARILGISRTSISRFHTLHKSISLFILKKVLSCTNYCLDSVQKYVSWIGHSNSQGISNPKLPFDFRSREGARFLAGICNEGWISEACCYSNSSQELRNALRADALVVFGGEKEQFITHMSSSDMFIRFPCIVKETLMILTGFAGKKSVNNPSIPAYIFSDTNFLLGWIEQTIADEGTVKYYPKKYRREIWWKRAFLESLDRYNLHVDECNMLDLLGLKYSSYTTWTYDSLDGKKVHAQLRIVGRRSIRFLDTHLRIPLQRKRDLLTEMASSYERYKERIRIWQCIQEIASSKVISSHELQKRMKYTSIGTARKWLKHYNQEGRIRKIGREEYLLNE